MSTTAATMIWIIAFFAPNYHTGGLKLVIHKFETQAQCQASIPQLKRYYRLYGKKWTYDCAQTVQKKANDA